MGAKPSVEGDSNMQAKNSWIHIFLNLNCCGWMTKREFKDRPSCTITMSWARLITGGRIQNPGLCTCCQGSVCLTRPRAELKPRVTPVLGLQTLCESTPLSNPNTQTENNWSWHNGQWKHWYNRINTNHQRNRHKWCWCTLAIWLPEITAAYGTLYTQSR